MIILNIEAFNAESLIKFVMLFEYENRQFKEKLKNENISFDELNPFEATMDNVEEHGSDQSECIINHLFITEGMERRFFSMFWGREDVL